MGGHLEDTRLSQPFSDELLVLSMIVGLFTGDDLLRLPCRSIVCFVVTVSPMADGGLKAGCLSS